MACVGGAVEGGALPPGGGLLWYRSMPSADRMVYRTTSPHPLYIPVHIQTDNRQTRLAHADQTDKTHRPGRVRPYLPSVFQCHFETDPDPWIRTLDLDPNLYPDPALHVTVFQETNKKYRKCFCLLLTVGTFTSVFKDSKSLRCHKTKQLKLRFLNFFACWWKDPDPDPYK